MRNVYPDEEQFGVPSENIAAAQRRKLSRNLRRPQLHTRVPTRREVFQLPADHLTPLLVGWMEHSPVEIIPSAAQIQLVIQVLQTRPDALALAPLVTMCRHYANAS